MITITVQLKSVFSGIGPRYLLLAASKAIWLPFLVVMRPGCSAQPCLDFLLSVNFVVGAAKALLATDSKALGANLLLAEDDGGPTWFTGGLFLSKDPGALRTSWNGSSLCGCLVLAGSSNLVAMRCRGLASLESGPAFVPRGFVFSGLVSTSVVSAGFLS